MEGHVCQLHHSQEYCKSFYSWNVQSLKFPFHMIFNFFFLAKAKSLHFIQNEITIFKIFQGNENLVSWLPHLLTMFQKSWRSIEHSDCLALGLLGGSQLRLSVLLSLETLTSPLLWELQGVWCKSRLQYKTQASGLGLGGQGFKQSPRGLKETSMSFCCWDFSQNFLVFQIIPVLKSWRVFRGNTLFPFVSGKKRMRCMCNFPSFDVSILNSTQRLNWFLSFHLLSSSEEHF